MSKQLLQINVNENTEKKGGLTYLSWAWAWAEVLKFDESATWEIVEYPQADGTLAPCMWIGDTAMVKTVVTINGMVRACQLPVMDNRNNAVKNPDARKISDSIMRCMTKAISMHGLGLYIYAGEDLPEELPRELTPEEKAEQERQAKRQAELDDVALDMIEAFRAGKEMDAAAIWYSAETFDADAGTGNEERLYVWGQLKTESKLRAFIKANKPDAISA